MNKEKKVSLMQINSNPNIGLYMYVNDHFALIGEDMEKKKLDEIEKILKVPIYKITALGTGLIGVFITGNNENLIIPKLYNHEKEKIKEICKKHNIKLLEYQENINTFGNSLCIIKNKIITDSRYPKKFIKQLEKDTGLKITNIKNKELDSPGSLCKYINNKLIISQELEEKDVKEFINDISGLATVNSGSIFISSGIVGNSNGLLIGSASSTIEIQNIVEILDFI